MKTRLFAIILCVSLVFALMTQTAAALENPFSDVQPTDWYYDSVLYVYENSLFFGVSADKFSPDKSMTRAMFVSVLFRQASSLGYDTAAVKSGFSDLPKDWYQDAISWASANGIVNGVTATTFQPDREITREQMCVIIIRYLRDYLDYDLSAYAGLADFSDRGKVSAYAADAVAMAQHMNLISGKSIGGEIVFDPQSCATRAAVAKVVMLESKLLDSLSGTGATAGSSGGSGTGSGTVAHTQEELAQEAQIAQDLTTMVNNYNQSEYIGTVDAAVKSCMDVLMKTLSEALTTHNAGIFLNQDYVTAHYSSQIALFKSDYKALTDDQVNQLRQVVIRLGTTYEIQDVMDYFGVSTAYFS